MYTHAQVYACSAHTNAQYMYLCKNIHIIVYAKHVYAQGYNYNNLTASVHVN